MYDDVVWAVGSRVDNVMDMYRNTPKSKSKKETVMHTPREVRDFYRRIMEIGQPIEDE